MKDIANRFKCHGDALTDCLEYIFNCGDIIWLETHPKLKDFVFHKPQKLVEALKGVINHDIRNILNYDNNKSFSSVSKLSEVRQHHTLSFKIDYIAAIHVNYSTVKKGGLTSD